MRFWDSSALVPLLVEEEASATLEVLFLDDEGVAAWWATEVECASALARFERSGELAPDAVNEAFQRLAALAGCWHVVDPAEGVRSVARRLLRVHDLRAGEALQLAAAFVAAEGRPESLELVCLDERLALAAQREGFVVIHRSAL